MCPGSIKKEFTILVSRSEADDFTFETDLLYDQCCSYILIEETLQDVFLVCCTVCVLCGIKMVNITLSFKKHVGVFSPSVHPFIYKELHGTIWPVTYRFIDVMATHALAIHNLHCAQWTARNVGICETSRRA